MEPLQKIRLPAAGSSRSREAFSHPDIVFPLSVEIFPIAASFRLLQRNDHVPGALRRHEVVFAIGGRKKSVGRLPIFKQQEGSLQATHPANLSIVPKDFLGVSQNALLGRPMKTVFRKSVDADGVCRRDKQS